MPGRKQDEARKLKRSAESCISIRKFFRTEPEVTELQKSTAEAEPPLTISEPYNSQPVAQSSTENVLQQQHNEEILSPKSTAEEEPPTPVAEFYNSQPVTQSSTENVLQQHPTEEILSSLTVAEPCNSQPATESSQSTQYFLPQKLTEDIGHIITATLSAYDVYNRVSNLSDVQRYHLLKHHFIPDADFKFPFQYGFGCNRSFQLSWLQHHPWLVYSKVLDGAFCIKCALFANPRDKLGVLVNKPFTNWRKKSEILTTHITKKYHLDAHQVAESFVQTIEHPERTIEGYSSNFSEENYKRNLKILKYCIDTVLFCGRQCISLRNRNERNKSGEDGNPGNFIALLRAFGEHDQDLKKHLMTPDMQNATYLSPQTQNEIIEIIGKQFLQKQIVGEIIKAKYFTILADEVESHLKKICSLCIRFVDQEKNIREEFLEFIPLVRTTGEHIGGALIKTIQSLGLDIENSRGQGYDGCSAMSSEAVGVQAVIKRSSPQALYIHCYGHCLNLVIAHSCKLPNVRNVIDIMKETCLFFIHSPKRTGLLESILNNEITQSSKRKAILDLCKTRWAMRHVAYSHFYTSFVYIVKALEVIAYSLHEDTISTDFTSGWDTSSKSNASSLLRALCSFEFIVSFLSIYKMLSHLSGITEKLQGRCTDILQAFTDVEEVKVVYGELRENIHTEFSKIYQHAITLASAVNVDPSRPRITGRQQHRSNVQPISDDIENYFLRNLAIPFLDTIIMQLSERFSSVARKCAGLLALVPNRDMCTSEQSESLKNAVNIFQDDLPNPELINEELFHWNLYWKNVSTNDLPTSAAQSLKKCDETLFPNIFTLLKLICTLPTTSCECERTFSALRRLNTYNRCSMTNERLSSLALIHIHYDMDIDIENVIKAFCQKQPRRMNFGNIMKD